MARQHSVEIPAAFSNDDMNKKLGTRSAGNVTAQTGSLLAEFDICKMKFFKGAGIPLLKMSIINLSGSYCAQSWHP